MFLSERWQPMAVPGSNGTLSIKQEALLTLLLLGKSTEQAATEAGIAERTAYRWVKEPHFKDALEDAKKKAFDRKLSMLKDNVNVALVALARNMGEKAPPGVQVAAAKCWLELAIELYRVDE